MTELTAEQQEFIRNANAEYILGEYEFRMMRGFDRVSVAEARFTRFMRKIILAGLEKELEKEL